MNCKNITIKGPTRSRRNHTGLKMIDKYTNNFCPVLRYFASGIHWSVMQVDYATDIIFKDQKTLAPIYEELVRTLSHAVKPNNIAMFLGKRLDPRFEGELGEQFSTRIEGHSIRHYMNKNGFKIAVDYSHVWM